MPGLSLGVLKSGVVYYPFGLTFNSYSRENSVPNNFLFQEKEWQDELSLNVYDFDWRQYDPAIGRTSTQDPHAGRYWDLSPYSFLGNNPLNILDPTGMDTVKSENLDMHTFKPEEDVVVLPEVVVTPTNEHGVQMIEIEEEGEEYDFATVAHPDFAGDNTIANYLYYLRHQDEFKDENGTVAPIKDVFRSERQIHEDILEDILLEWMLLKGPETPGVYPIDNTEDAVMDRIREQRKSKYTMRFPANKKRAREREEQRLKDKAKMYGVSVETIKIIETNPSTNFLEQF